MMLPRKELVLSVGEGSVWVEEAVNELQLNGVIVQKWAEQLIGILASKESGSPIQLVATRVVLVTPEDLGVEDEFVSEAYFFELAGSHGLNLCRPEVGLALAFQYGDQPIGEYVVVAMDSIPNESGTPLPKVFTISCLVNKKTLKPERVLSCNYGRPNNSWSKKSLFAFVATA